MVHVRRNLVGLAAKALSSFCTASWNLHMPSSHPVCVPAAAPCTVVSGCTASHDLQTCVCCWKGLCNSVQQAAAEVRAFS